MQNIRINSDENYYNTPLTPIGVYSMRVADEQSRKIFAVAALRTFGIPARLKPGTLEPEFWWKGQWTVMSFTKTTATTADPATLVLRNDPANPLSPQYETHYTLAHFANGKYNTLAYGYETSGDPLKVPLELDPGFYLLVTGNRQPGGKVLTGLTYFDLQSGDTKELVITLRKSDRAPDVIATINPMWEAKKLDNSAFMWPSASAGHLVIAWIEPDKEPTKHLFQDLGSLKSEVDKLGCQFVFLIPDDKLPAGFRSDTWKSLPANSTFAVIDELVSLQELEKSSGQKLGDQFPVVIVSDEKGQVTYLSSGYKIGIGEELVKLLSGSGN
jgi:hypothetical protein